MTSDTIVRRAMSWDADGMTSTTELTSSPLVAGRSRCVAQAPADDSCSLTMQWHFSGWNNIMAAILKLWRQIEKWKSDSVNLCVLAWRTIPPNFIPIRFEMFALGFLKNCSPTGRRTTRWVAIWDQFLIQVECTIDQELTMLLHSRREDALFWLARWQHFDSFAYLPTIQYAYDWLIDWFSACNDAMAAILKAQRQIENPTPSIDSFAYLPTIPVKFHPDPIWNHGALGFSKVSHPQQEEEQDE